MSSYTKAGCLVSLKHWSDVAGASVPPADFASSVFFLGDSYLVYDFAYMSEEEGQSFLTFQSADFTKRSRVEPARFIELQDMISAARTDVPPATPSGGVHTTCVVFLDSRGNYFAVQPDAAGGSRRPTDKAIVLLDRLDQELP